MVIAELEGDEDEQEKLWIALDNRGEKESLIKNSDVLERFEREMIKKEKLSFEQALALFEAMWQEGVNLGVLPPKNPLEGIEVDIRIARILNCLKKS